MTEEKKESVRKRRTPEELRAHYQAKLKEIEEDEKKEVIRLLSGVHDDLQKASTYKCAPQLAAVISATKAALAALGVK